MQLALIIPISGENLPQLPGGIWGPGGTPTPPVQPVPPPSREEIRAAVKEWLEHNFPPDKREEIRQKVENLVNEIREKLESRPPHVWPRPPGGAGQLPEYGRPEYPGQALPGAPSRDDVKAAIRAKAEEWLASLNPPSRDEVRQKLEDLTEKLKDKVGEILPEGCLRPQPK